MSCIAGECCWCGRCGGERGEERVDGGDEARWSESRRDISRRGLSSPPCSGTGDAEEGTRMWGEGVGDMLVKKNLCTRIKGWRHALIHPERSCCHCCLFPLSYILCPYPVEYLTHEHETHVTSEAWLYARFYSGRPAQPTAQAVSQGRDKDGTRTSQGARRTTVSKRTIMKNNTYECCAQAEQRRIATSATW